MRVRSSRTFPMKRSLCLELSAKKSLAEIIAATNKMRNDWTGHGGVVGQEEARFRNDQLI